MDTNLPPKRETLGLPDGRGVDLALAFAELAKNDLRASRILYQRKLYPQAIFELQQAVEKAMKAVGLLLGLVRPTREDLTREVGHAAVFAILVRLPERLTQLRRNLGVLAASEELKEGKELIMKLGLPWNIPDPREMEARLTNERAAQAEVQRLRNLKPGDLWKITLESDSKRPPIPAVLKLLKDAETQWKQFDRFQKLFEKKLAPLMSDPQTLRYILNIHGKAFPEVAPLAFITIWHEKETRYPPIDSLDYWDPKKYTADTGLMKLYPRLCRHAKRLSDGASTGAQAALKV